MKEYVELMRERYRRAGPAGVAAGKLIPLISSHGLGMSGLHAPHSDWGPQSRGWG